MNLKEIADLKSGYLKEMARLMNFSEEELELIISFNLFRFYKKGTFLLKKGQFSETSYFVIKGCLKSWYMLNGEEKVTDFFAENDLFTSTCITTNRPSELYLDCVEDSLVSVVNPENEKIMMEKFPRFEKLCRISAEKSLVEQKSAFDQFKFASSEERYINFAKTKSSLVQRVPQYQIASYLGLTPQSLSRIRKRLLNAERKSQRIAV